MIYQYEPKGVCSMQMNIEVEGEIIKDVQILGGCAGNTKGVSVLEVFFCYAKRKPHTLPSSKVWGDALLDFYLDVVNRELLRLKGNVTTSDFLGKINLVRNEKNNSLFILLAEVCHEFKDGECGLIIKCVGCFVEDNDLMRFVKVIENLYDSKTLLLT